MSKQEIVGELSQNQGNWLFVDGQMVDANTLENTSITQDNVLRMVPSIVGGWPSYRAEIWNQYQEHWEEQEKILCNAIYSPDWITYYCGKKIDENFDHDEFNSKYNFSEISDRIRVKRIPKEKAAWYEAKIWNEETQNWVSEEIHLQAWLNSDDFLLYADGEKIDSETAYKDIIDRISKRRDTSIKVIVNSYCER